MVFAYALLLQTSTFSAKIGHNVRCIPASGTQRQISLQVQPNTHRHYTYTIYERSKAVSRGSAEERKYFCAQRNNRTQIPFQILIYAAISLKFAKPIRTKQSKMEQSIADRLKERAEIFEHYIIHARRIKFILRSIGEEKRRTRNVYTKRNLLERENELLDMILALNEYTQRRFDEIRRRSISRKNNITTPSSISIRSVRQINEHSTQSYHFSL